MPIAHHRIESDGKQYQARFAGFQPLAVDFQSVANRLQERRLFRGRRFASIAK